MFAYGPFEVSALALRDLSGLLYFQRFGNMQLVAIANARLNLVVDVSVDE